MLRRLLLRALLLICISLPAWAEGLDVRVQLQGLPDTIEPAVLQSLTIQQQKDHPLMDETLLQRLHKQTPGEIQSALEVYGYYQAKVEGTLTQEDKTWQARYTIDPGPAVHIQQVDVKLTGEGSSDPALIRWQAGLPLHPGDVFAHQPYEEAKRDLQRLARERGYLDGDFTVHEVTVDVPQHSAVIRLRFDTGPRYRFGPVSFRQDDFDPDFLRRFVTFSTGDPYSTATLLKVQRALSDSDYFERVEVRPHKEAASNLEVPVEIILQPRKPTRYSAGIGYGTDTGPRGSLGVERRRLNRYGHRLGSDLKLSSIRTELDAWYRIPLERPAHDSFAVNAGWVDEETETTNRETLTLSAGFTHLLDSHWQRNIALSYEEENYDVGGDAGRSTLLIPKLGFQRVKADDRIRTRHGWSVTTELRGAAQAILSDATFLQGRLGGKYIQALNQDTRLIARGDLGLTWVSQFSDLPASQRFFAGGDRSVRGYDYNTLGPKNDAGEVVGGRHLLVGSLEMERDLSERFAAAVFYDAGNAFDDLSIALEEGAGVGLRWRLPIGTVRVDLAWALTEPGQPWRLHFNIGPDL